MKTLDAESPMLVLYVFDLRSDDKIMERSSILPVAVR